jgi:hypothetical protein
MKNLNLNGFKSKAQKYRDKESPLLIFASFTFSYSLFIVKTSKPSQRFPEELLKRRCSTFSS